MRQMIIVSSESSYQAIAGAGFLDGVRNDASYGFTGYEQRYYTIKKPSWAKFLRIYFNVLSSSGTAPSAAMDVQIVDPIKQTPGWTGGAGAWIPNQFEYTIFSVTVGASGLASLRAGPGVTGIADDTAGLSQSVNEVISDHIGIFPYFVAGGASPATYTYTIEVLFTD